MSGPPREHRIGSYNKGCRCDNCRRHSRNAKRRHRARARARRFDLPVVCTVCPARFAREHGMHVHRGIVHGWL